MKIKIEADFPAGTAKKIISAICSALVQKETAELLEAFPAGENEHFNMNDDRRGIIIKITKL